MQDRRLTIAVLACAVMASAWAAPLVRLAGAPSPAIAAWRLAIAVGLLLPLFLFGGGLGEWRAQSARDRGIALLSGTALALHFATWISSVKLTSIAASSLLVALSPVFAWFLSWKWLGERPTPRQGFGLVVAVVGAAVIALGDWGGDAPNALLGDALALAGAAFGAVYFVSGRHLRARLGLVAYVTPVYGTAAVLLMIWAASQGLAFAPYPPTDWLIFAGLAIGPTLIGHSGLNFALRQLPAWAVGAVALAEPIGATFIAALLPAIAEPPSRTILAGGALCLAGIILVLSAPREAAR